MPRSILVSFSLCTAVLLAACQPMTANGKSGVAGQQPVANAAAPAVQPPAVPIVVFLLAQDKAAKNWTKVELSKTRSIYVLPKVELSRSDLSKVEPIRDSKGQSFVSFTFTPDGARKLADVSRHNVGKILALTINGTLIAIPRIGKPMTDGVLGIRFASDQIAIGVARAVIGNPPAPAQGAATKK
jgi:hypothetical protein